MFFSIKGGVIFVPSRAQQMQKLVERSGLKPGMKMVDLGSGDGRIVIAFAQAGIEAHGYEINPLLIWLSRWKIRKTGLTDKAFIHKQSVFTVDVSPYDCVVVFLVPPMLRKLEQSFAKQIKPSAIVFSNAFAFPNMTSQERDRNWSIYNGTQFRGES